MFFKFNSINHIQTLRAREFELFYFIIEFRANLTPFICRVFQRVLFLADLQIKLGNANF